VCVCVCLCGYIDCLVLRSLNIRREKKW